MLTFLVVMASLVGYTLPALTLTRVLYIREYKKYLARKGTEGTYMHSFNDSYAPPPRQKSNKELTYHTYRQHVANTCPPGLAGAFWWVYLPTVAVQKFVHPEVKAPDYTKIKELENM